MIKDKFYRRIILVRYVVIVSIFFCIFLLINTTNVVNSRCILKHNYNLIKLIKIFSDLVELINRTKNTSKIKIICYNDQNKVNLR